MNRGFINLPLAQSESLEYPPKLFDKYAKYSDSDLQARLGGNFTNDVKREISFGVCSLQKGHQSISSPTGLVSRDLPYWGVMCA